MTHADGLFFWLMFFGTPIIVSQFIYRKPRMEKMSDDWCWRNRSGGGGTSACRPLANPDAAPSGSLTKEGQ